MRRFAIFVTVLAVVVAVGSQPWPGNSQPRSVSQKRSVCVCMASKAALLMKSISAEAVSMTKQSPPPAPPVDRALAAE